MQVVWKFKRGAGFLGRIFGIERTDEKPGFKSAVRLAQDGPGFEADEVLGTIGHLYVVEARSKVDERNGSTQIHGIAAGNSCAGGNRRHNSRGCDGFRLLFDDGYATGLARQNRERPVIGSGRRCRSQATGIGFLLSRNKLTAYNPCKCDQGDHDQHCKGHEP